MEQPHRSAPARGRRKYSRPAFIPICTAFLALLACAAGAQTLESPRVLLINSYHPGYPWTDALTTGFRETILSTFPFAEVFIEYMDTKRYFDGPNGSYVGHLTDLYKLKYANTHIDLIAVSDDNAYNYILTHEQALFGDIPVVFCGVNDYLPAAIAGRSNITGVTGNSDDAATIDLMRRLQPGLQTVYVITDRTTTGLENRSRVEALSKQYAGELTFRFADTGRDLDYRRMLNEVSWLPDRSAVLYEDFFRDSTGTYFPMTTVVPAVARAASVPVYVIHDMYLGLGVLGGKVNSGTQMGKMAADLAVRILSGTPPASIAPVVRDVNRYVVDYSALRRFHIPERDLPHGTVVANRPENVYTRYPLTAWSATAIIIAALALLVTMSFLLLQRRRMNHALRAANENLRVTLNSIGDGVITTDRRGYLTTMNPIAERLTGWIELEAVGQAIGEVFIIHNSVTGKPTENPVLRVLAEGNIVGLANHTVLTARDGAVRQIADSGAPIRDKAGNITGVIMVFRDVSEEYRRRSELTESERRLRESQEVARVGTWEIDLRKKLVWASEQARKIYGIEGEPQLLPLDVVQKQPLPEYRLQLDEAMKRLISEDLDYSREFRLRTLITGEIRTVLSRAKLLRDEQGNPVRVLGTIQDTTERATLVEQLRQSVREKELLVQEIHHRVKNNLQVIISLISLQRGRITEDGLRRGEGHRAGGIEADLLLKESQTRVQAMALLHEVLYRSSDLSRINVGFYLATVARHTFDAFNLHRDSRELQVSAEDVFIDIDRAIPCGLVINELVSNSMKYAFSDTPLLDAGFDEAATGKSRIIRLEIRGNATRLTLDVSDNGKGLPPDFDLAQTRSLGTELIRALAAQLRASIRHERSAGDFLNGTRWVIEVPLDS